MANETEQAATERTATGREVPAPAVPDWGPDEPYMSAHQLAWFRQRLLDWRVELSQEVEQTLERLRDTAHFEVGDELDRASREADQALELRTRDRCRKLVRKIDQALARIEDGSYGYCEETGEPIGIPRLVARPIATLSLEAQERRELKERQLRD